MKKKFKITSLKQYYILFAILALIVSTIILVIIQANNYPLKFRVDDKDPTDIHSSFIYNDLNNDGRSEKILLGKKKTLNKIFSSISVISHSGTFIDDFNLFARSNPSWIIFEDYNDDKYKDIFAFSQYKDSLFLSIINVKTKKYFLNRYLLLTKPDSAKRNFWDLTVIPAGLLNYHNHKNLIFCVTAGYSLYPRTIYSFNIKDRKIEKSFPTKASIQEIFLSDLNSNGKKEIIARSAAVGNIPDKYGYNDYTSWLFVLNDNLKPVFPPKYFSKYPFGGVQLPINSPTVDNKILCTFSEKTDSATFGKIFFINASGKIHYKTKFPERITSLITFDNHRKLNYMLTLRNGNVCTLNSNFDDIKIMKSNANHLKIIARLNNFIKDENIFLCGDQTKLYVIDDRLHFLASIDLENGFASRNNYYSIRLNGDTAPPQLAIRDAKFNYLLSIVENKIYAYSWLIFAGSSFLLFFLFVGVHRVNSYLSTYISYFTHSLQKSNNGIVILDYSGRVTFINGIAKNILKLKGLAGRPKYAKIFKNYPPFLNALSEAIDKRTNLRREISYSTPEKEFKGEISITPFTSFAGYTYSYLFEISDYTIPLLTDRSKVWSSTVQRIAHEIKTPLSTIQLNLKTLQMHLDDETVEYRDKIEGDIEMMKAEVQRIKVLVKGFLNFTSINKPNYEYINLTKLLYESLKQFTSYTSKGIEIVWNLAENAETVFGDKNQLVQLFHLILENAIDSMNGKGRIEIATKTDNEVSSGDKTGFVIIEIKDSGHGVPPEIIEKVFEPYFTTKKDGTGIGLALAKKIVEDHNGRIELESKVNYGTIAKIILPV